MKYVIMKKVINYDFCFMIRYVCILFIYVIDIIFVLGSSWWVDVGLWVVGYVI